LYVDAIALDDYAVRHDLARVDFVKLDIEGAELPALRGMIKLLATHRPILLLEVNRSNCEAAGYAPEAIAELLRAHGYRFWLVGGSPLESGPRDGFDGVEHQNFLCHTAELPSTVAGGWSYRNILRRRMLYPAVQ
jgi:hypothetical protein